MNEFFDASTNNHRKREIGMNSDCCYVVSIFIGAREDYYIDFL